MNLAHPHQFSYFSYSSTKLGTLCYPLSLFTDVPFILEHVPACLLHWILWVAYLHHWFILFKLEYGLLYFFLIFGSLFLKANKTQHQGPSKILYYGFFVLWHVSPNGLPLTYSSCSETISGVLTLTIILWFKIISNHSIIIRKMFFLLQFHVIFQIWWNPLFNNKIDSLLIVIFISLFHRYNLTIWLNSFLEFQ